MFERIFIEEKLRSHPKAISILSKLKIQPTYISNYRDVFEKVKKPYLIKRQGITLFLAQKKGQLVKEAPNAYGLEDGPHYYFINAYNCVYECTYCYLQGHFDSPDLVLFINHEEIIEQMTNMTKLFRPARNDESIWFHAGEFSDSLALSHLSQELPLYFDFFRTHPRAKMELRTKSVNTKELEKLTPLNNVITSFSLSPEEKINKHDLRTPPLHARLKAIKRLQDLGHPVAIHFDPIIWDEKIIDQYKSLLEQLKNSIDLEFLEYCSLGVVRFTKDVFHQVKKNYPKAEFHGQPMIKSFDEKIRYPRPLRNQLLNNIKNLCLDAGIDEKGIYFCME